ncbi:MAG: glucose-6-phosphate dehydrogenase [Deltaproteobacteria bacterium]
MEWDLENVDRYTDTVVKSHAPDLKIPPEMCIAEAPVEPCTIVVFGATGDLTRRKLAPSLYHLYLNGGLPESFAILGAARSEMSREQFQERIKQSAAGMDMSGWAQFADSLYYEQLQFDSPESFAKLSRTLESLEEKHKTRGNKIFYLALPPSFYGSTAEMLGDAGLAQEEQGGNRWSRIVVEKPFGRDLESAKRLNATLHKHFEERQIFRIDHYLAKETVQNVLILRFANAIFEPIWNRMFIDRVEVTATETLGVENRAAYYEQAGVLRDMFQNHMLQLLAVIAMEPPSRFDADRVRDETSKVFRSLRPFSQVDPTKHLVLGQYDAGTIDGRNVPGYPEEPKVAPDSLTPTFAMMKVLVDNWRWQGVPFYLTSGKRLAKKLTHIVIHFKRVPHSMFREFLGEVISPNMLTLGIYPEERIHLTFQTKNPGAQVCLRSVRMDFDYQENYSGPSLDAYEKVLIECMQGDQTLFWRQDAVELCWCFLDPILEDCETCADRGRRLRRYEAGSWGPQAGFMG